MRFIVCLALMALVTCGYSQRKTQLNIAFADGQQESHSGKFSYRKQHRDSAAAIASVQKLYSNLKRKGYLAASVDTMVIDSGLVSATIYIGQKVGDLVIVNNNIEESILSQSGIKSAIQQQTPIGYRQVVVAQEKILRYCENNGYPFAQVKLDSVQEYNQLWAAFLLLQKNDLVRLDTMRIVGQSKIKRVFLRNYLGLKTGKPYNEQAINRINQRLSELQFVEILQPHTVEFQNNKASVNLFLKDRKASQFNFLLGLLPGSSGQRVLITGEARFHLFSLFGVGEEFFIEWQKLQPKTQRLDVRVVYPYIAGLPLGINARFELYKRDTSWIDLNGDYGVQYQMAGSNYLKASLRQQSTIILNVDTALVKSSRRLPVNQDIRTNEFALEYFLQHLNYRFNPVQGQVLKVGASGGVKQIKVNNAIASLRDEITGQSFSVLYDTARLRSFQFRLWLSLDKYWKLAARHTIKTSFDGRYFYSPVIFENEKFRLGGINSLRGFDDQSIFTSYYAMVNVEYRFLLSKNSFFHTFFNTALVEEQRAFRNHPFDFPYGFGAGAAIETKAGIFGLTYAMGTQQNNPITFRSAKIHFGYVNYF